MINLGEIYLNIQKQLKDFYEVEEFQEKTRKLDREIDKVFWCCGMRTLKINIGNFHKGETVITDYTNNDKYYLFSPDFKKSYEVDLKEFYPEKAFYYPFG